MLKYPLFLLYIQLPGPDSLLLLPYLPSHSITKARHFAVLFQRRSKNGGCCENAEFRGVAEGELQGCLKVSSERKFGETCKGVFNNVEFWVRICCKLFVNFGKKLLSM